MSKQLGVIWGYLSHYKYLIVIVVGVLKESKIAGCLYQNFDGHR